MQKYRNAALAAFALATAGAAQAEVITFDNLEPVETAPFMGVGLFGHNDTFKQGNFALTTFSIAPGAASGDLVGALVNGSDTASTCVSVICPTGNPSTYFTALNDGVLHVASLSGQKFKFTSFDASFVAASDVAVPAVSLALRVQAYTDATNYQLLTVFLPGPTNGAYSFRSITNSPAIAAMEFTELYFFGLACNAGGNCSAFTSNQGQFALDNINVTAVPEPSEWLLVGLGLAVVGGVVRRRQAA